MNFKNTSKNVSNLYVAATKVLTFSFYLDNLFLSSTNVETINIVEDPELTSTGPKIMFRLTKRHAKSNTKVVPLFNPLKIELEY